ncbi:hypothetical protein NMY22_g18374 [Coprinellus aureogranulatus]|nr:hypothetical protein NMY22_g18374 [Coprinellus aureogranulatus]
MIATLSVLLSLTSVATSAPMAAQHALGMLRRDFPSQVPEIRSPLGSYATPIVSQWSAKLSQGALVASSI